MSSENDQVAAGIPAPVEAMSWSGLIGCSLDGIAALRTYRDYSSSDCFREKVDSLAKCVEELTSRLSALKCLPAPGEPSFTLLARDPQAADRVEDWVRVRQGSDDPSPNAQRKILEASELAAAMRSWKGLHPNLLASGTPSLSRTVEDGEGSPPSA